MARNDKQLAAVREMLRDAWAARSGGQPYPRMARAYGYVDGYMRALLELGSVSKEELLALVAEERRRAGGPAFAPLSREGDDAGEIVAA